MVETIGQGAAQYAVGQVHDSLRRARRQEIVRMMSREGYDVRDDAVQELVQLIARRPYRQIKKEHEEIVDSMQ